MSIYSRHSSSSSSRRSAASTITVKSANFNVPRSKSLFVVTYLAGGDPRKHKNLRWQKTTTEYENGTYETISQYFWVRDPYESTYYWKDDCHGYNDGSSVYSSSSRGSARRSKNSGHKSRVLPATVPMRPIPPPMGTRSMPSGGMPPQMCGYPQPMMGDRPPPWKVVDEVVDDDDSSSMYSGDSYIADSSLSSHGTPPPPHNMGMPHMPPPPPMQRGPLLSMGLPMTSGMHTMPSRSNHAGDDNGGGGLPEFFTL
ncbi:hypothetical protein F5883DRAFT_576104 [Diaporthe sp. PMI_573]|jgi:hypothetical protein|nr:hypothetical protein F5883DRAFT_576104 [Diaporthaceae sp. PMI_573]